MISLMCYYVMVVCYVIVLQCDYGRRVELTNCPWWQLFSQDANHSRPAKAKL